MKLRCPGSHLNAYYKSVHSETQVGPGTQKCENSMKILRDRYENYVIQHCHPIFTFISHYVQVIDAFWGTGQYLRLHLESCLYSWWYDFHLVFIFWLISSRWFLSIMQSLEPKSLEQLEPHAAARKTKESLWHIITCPTPGLGPRLKKCQVTHKWYARNMSVMWYCHWQQLLLATLGEFAKQTTWNLGFRRKSEICFWKYPPGASPPPFP